MQYLILYDDDLSEASFRSVGKIFKIYNNFLNLKKRKFERAMLYGRYSRTLEFFFQSALTLSQFNAL